MVRIVPARAKIERMQTPAELYARQRELLFRRLRVQLTYRWRHGEYADFDAPALLTEYIVHRKLYDDDPRLPRMSDKVTVKAHVAQNLDERWVIPTLWDGSKLPRKTVWPFPFVVKSRHGSGQIRIVRNDRDYFFARVVSACWMRTTYGKWLDEWLYRHISRGLLIEPFIGEGRVLPIDYKLFVFGGRVRFVQVHLDRATNHRWIVFDLNWRRVSPPTADIDPRQPSSLGQMIEAAELLGKDFPFVRIDFYEAGERPLFGEMTFYPGSGLEPIRPPALNAAMGALWTAALNPFLAVESVETIVAEVTRSGAATAGSRHRKNRSDTPAQSRGHRMTS